MEAIQRNRMEKKEKKFSNNEAAHYSYKCLKFDAWK